MKIEIGAPEIRAKVRAPKVTAETGTPVAREYTERPAYEGPYTVTPGASVQTLDTENLRMTDNVTVQAIPGDYVGPNVQRQAATTITPTTSAQTAVAAGKYTEGAVTVGPIPPEYIIPTGTLTITENGEGMDVSAYAEVDVAVPDNVFVVTIYWDDESEMWVPDKTYEEIYEADRSGVQLAVVPDLNYMGRELLVQGGYDIMYQAFIYTAFDGAKETKYRYNEYGLTELNEQLFGYITWDGSVLTVS